MYDKTEKIMNSLVQHGKENDRIYLMKLAKEDYPDIVKKLVEVAEANGYSKIFTKVDEQYFDAFVEEHFLVEARVPNFFEGEREGFFLAKYFGRERQKISDPDTAEIEDNIRLALSKMGQGISGDIPKEYKLEKLGPDHAEALSQLYKIVFPSYPFPIHDPGFIREAMQDNVEFFGVIELASGKLVAASSAEKYDEYKNVEMTDFATDPDHLGKGLALYLLGMMEREMRGKDFKNMYTIARSHSAGMNITFAKNGYEYAGTLINNTNIFGRIESMNVWYKLL